ncbi:MAG: NHL repeat-containing protein [Acidobacteriaceae bacterium]
MILGFAAMFSSALIAGAQTSPPPLVVTQTNWLAALPSGRVLTGANAAGTSFAVNANGEVAIGNTFGNQVMLFNGQTGATEKTWPFLNPGAVAMDGQGNLYVAALNTNWIVKLPYANGTYADLTNDPQTTPPPACTGSDTQECAWGINLQGNGAFGVSSMTFDSQGNFFYVTNSRGAVANQYSIFGCSVASGCLATASAGSGTGVALKLFSEPAATNPSPYCSSTATMQIMPGSIAVDPWGNVFFTDSALDSCGTTDGSVDQSDYSDVNELPLIGGNYAAAPVTLFTFTPTPPLPYNDQIVAVGVDAKGTVYFSAEYDGVLAFANDGTAFNGPVPQADIYGVWTYQGWTNGARALALDGKGNLYVVTSLAPVTGTTNIDTLGRVSLNSLPFPASPVGTGTNLTTPQSVTSAVHAADSTVVMVNDADCSTASVGFAVKQDGKPSSEFSGGAGTCVNSSFLGGQSELPLTLTFTPAKVGARSAVLTAIDIATGNSQAATAFGVGQGGLVALDSSGNMLAYPVTSNPAGIAVDAAGNWLFAADTTANAVDKIAAGSPTLTPIGSGFSGPSGVALDASGNLYVADTGNNQVVKIPSATGTPGTQVTVVPSSAQFGGVTLNGPTGLAVGADGVLYISDTGNNRVVTYNPANGVTGVRAALLNHPAGIAVDAADTLYIANAGAGSGGNVEVFPGGGGAVTTLTPNGVTTPASVAVDASGSVLISDGPTGAVVRVPNEGGTLNSGDAQIVAKNPTSGGGLALDAAGNLYTTDALSAAVYVMQRTSATVLFGNVNDGATQNSFSLSAENAGNLPLALASGATSFLTQPTSGNFTITAGFPNDCVAATSLASGSVCEFIAVFSPSLGTASGDLTDTSDFNSTAVNPTAVITLKGTAEYQSALNFTLAIAAPSLNVKAGGSAGTTVTVTPLGGFNAAVMFNCSGLPVGVTCSFSPASVPLSGGAAATTQLTVTATATSAALRQDSSPLFPGGAALACVMFFCFGLRKRRGLLSVLLLATCLTGLGMMTGCGVHVPPKSTTATITVNGVSGSMQNSATFTLTIQP